MKNFYEHGLESSIEKVAFFGLAARGLGAIGSRIASVGRAGYSSMGKFPSTVKNDFNRISSRVKNTDFYNKVQTNLGKSESLSYLKKNLSNIKNKHTTFQTTHPNAVNIGLGAAGVAGGSYLGNRMYRSLQQIGRQIPEDFQNNVQ